MKRADIGEFLVEIVEGLNEELALDYIDVTFDELRKSIARDGIVTISGFGEFALKEKRESLTRFSRTAEGKTPHSLKTVMFEPSDALKEVLSQKMSSSEGSTLFERMKRKKS